MIMGGSARSLLDQANTLMEEGWTIVPGSQGCGTVETSNVKGERWPESWYWAVLQKEDE
jgi:hypothetical protein